MNKEVTLIIEGMTCASCSAAVERVTKKVPGVESSQVNLATNRARIVYDPEQVTIEMLCERIERAGFGFLVVTRMTPPAARAKPSLASKPLTT
ncbi:MAG: heavy-metal-associated domain-containing protein [Lachnospiraceae bacterium]|nr:heavy-metal-associated domain-containing protein [Lachnospiraceae bacterium]